MSNTSSWRALVSPTAVPGAILLLSISVCLQSACGADRLDPVPSAERTTIVVSRAPVEVGGSGVLVEVTVRNARGRELAGVDVELSSSGTDNLWTPDSVLRTGAAGVASAHLVSTRAEVKHIVATIAGSAFSVDATATFQAGPPSPEHSTIQADPPRAAADAVAVVTVRAALRDDFDNPVSGVDVELTGTGVDNRWSSTSLVSVDGAVTVALRSRTPQVEQLVAMVDGEPATPAASVEFFAGTSDVLVSEIGAIRYGSVTAWLEVYNPTSAAVDLASYALRSWSLPPGGGSSIQGSFALPHATIPPSGFLVIAGRTSATQVDGERLVHVSDPAGNVPFWGSSGYVELVREDATVDFVRFGDDTSTPLTPDAWTAGAAPALDGDVGVRAALVRSRAETDTDQPTDWQLVRFATPGAVNDVAPGDVDTDGDGVPDRAKQPGGTFAGLDLYSMGARPGQRDVFVEIDAMDAPDPAVTPQRAAIASVVARFAAHGISLHVDAGSRYSSIFDPSAFNLGQETWSVPAADCVALADAACATLDEYAARYFALARRAVFHYALFGTTQASGGGAGPSGAAIQGGTELLVTLSHWGLSTTSIQAANVLTNYQAAALMHELGHNFGLTHGGLDGLNYKPNYLSAMNYLYTFAGIPDPADASAGDAYLYKWYGGLSLCDLPRGPCSTADSFALDYSSGTGLALSEEGVCEGDGLGFGGASVDFDGNGTIDSSCYALDLNRDGSLDVLVDNDDWGAIVLPFGSNPSTSSVQGPFGGRARPVEIESVPAVAEIEELRALAAWR